VIHDSSRAVILDKSSTTLGSSIRFIDARAVDAADGEATALARQARDRLSPANSPRKKQAQRIPGEIEAPFRAAMLATIPQLRAFAFSLLRNIDRADDLVQETLLRAAPGAEMADRSCRRTDFRSRYRRT
jgi:hypothetical protein